MSLAQALAKYGLKFAPAGSKTLLCSAIERCAQVAEQYASESGYAHEIAQEIRELKDSQ